MNMTLALRGQRLRARATKWSLFGAPVTLHGLIRYTAASAPPVGVAALSTEAVAAAAAEINDTEHNTVNYYMKMRRPVDMNKTIAIVNSKLRLRFAKPSLGRRWSVADVYTATAVTHVDPGSRSERPWCTVDVNDDRRAIMRARAAVAVRLGVRPSE